MKRKMNKRKINLLKHIVNLDAYGQSPDFIGYYEADPQGNREEQAIDLFIDFFSGKINECILICSVTQSVFTEDSFTDERKRIIKSLVDKGWFEMDKEDEAVQRDFNTFTLNQDDTEDIRTVCRLVSDNCTYGHVFFLWEKDQLVVYPHEEIGFGVLAPPGTEGESIGIDFLSKAAETGIFETDLRRTLLYDPFLSRQVA